jgi:hypothetical protein
VLIPKLRRICIDLAPERRVRLGLGFLFSKATLERSPVRDEPGGSRAAHARVGAHQTEGFDQPTVGEDIEWSDIGTQEWHTVLLAARRDHIRSKARPQMTNG